MNLLSLLNWKGTQNWSRHVRCREAMRLISAKAKQDALGRCVIDGGRQFGHRLTLIIAPVDGGIMVQASSSLTFKAENLGSHAMRVMLTENSKYRVGSTRLLETPGMLKLTQGQFCDPERLDSYDIAEIGRTLLAQFKGLMKRLHDLGIINDGC